LIDPFQVETGIDPFALDPSWSLVKADLSLTGVSADTGYELVSLNLQPAPVSYEAIDSPVELTVSTLIRRLLPNAGTISSTDTQPGDDHTKQDHRGDTQHNRQPRESFHHRYDSTQQVQNCDSGYLSQQPGVTVRNLEQRVTLSQPERPAQDRGVDLSDAVNPKLKPNSGNRGSIGDPATSSPVTNDQPEETDFQDQPQTDPITQRFDGLSQFEDRVNAPLGDPLVSVEPEEKQTSNTSTPEQQRERCPATVNPRPPQWEPTMVEPPTLTMDDSPLPEAPIIEAAAPPRDPFTEIKQGLDSIGVDNVIEKPPNQAIELGCEGEQIDTTTAVFGGETGEEVENTLFSCDVTVDDDTIPLWGNGCDSQEDLFDIDFRL
jgi:hypothetical protein